MNQHKKDDLKFLAVAIGTTAVFCLLMGLLATAVLADDKAWVAELTQELRAIDGTGEQSVRVSYCGLVRKSDLSRAIRAVDKGARPKLTKKGNQWYARYLYKKEGQKLTILKRRKITFTCHHRSQS